MFWQTALHDRSYSDAARNHGLENSSGVLIGHNSILQLSDTGAPYDRLCGKHAFRQITRPKNLVTAFRGASVVSLDGNSDAVSSGFWPHALLHAADLRLRLPVVLMEQGDSTRPLPGGQHLAVLERPWIAAHFVQTPAIKHPKVFAFPRGIGRVDVWRRTLSSRNYSTHQKVRDRPNLVLAGCMSNRAGRGEKLKRLEANGLTRYMGKCSEKQFSAQLLTSKFVVSPFGAGHNNHRDWEVLLAGAIPIVDYEPNFADMWDGLPVVQVKNWSTISRPFLEATWKRMQDERYSVSKAYLPYWLSMILWPPNVVLAPSTGLGEVAPSPQTMLMNLVQTSLPRGHDLFLVTKVGRGRVFEPNGTSGAYEVGLDKNNCVTEMAVTDKRYIARCWPTYWDSRRAYPSRYSDGPAFLGDDRPRKSLALANKQLRQLNASINASSAQLRLLRVEQHLLQKRLKEKQPVEIEKQLAKRKQQKQLVEKPKPLIETLIKKVAQDLSG